jgi:hypothetical protein
MALIKALPFCSIQDVKPIIRFSNATHYPVSDDVLGRFIDAMRGYESVGFILDNLLFQYGYYNLLHGEWRRIKMHDEDGLQYSVVEMKRNPKLSIEGFDGLFQLQFKSVESNGVRHVFNLQDLMKLSGKRMAFPVQVDATSGGIPKRFDSSLFRF